MILKTFSKEEKSWVYYDFASSVFSTMMAATVFPVFFMGMAGGNDTPGSFWWATGIIVARLIVGFLAPFIGALIDYEGYKKRVFAMSLAFGGFFTAFTAFVGAWELLLIGYILANIGFSICSQIHETFLPDVTTKDRMDKVSLMGYAFNYGGGSTIPLTASLLLIFFGHHIGLDNTAAVRISIIMTATWWMLFSIPFLRNVTHKHGKQNPEKGFFRETLQNTWATAKKIRANPSVFWFLIAYFFFIDGVGTIINMATSFGSEIGLSGNEMIGAIFVAQLVAVPFSLLFGRLAKRFGSINMIVVAILIYFMISLVAFVMGFGLEQGYFEVETAQLLFWLLAGLVGTSQGGIQGLSRSTYGKLVPAEHSGDFFGFFEIFGRFSSIMGPGLYAITLTITGRPSVSMLSVIVLFAIGLILLLSVKKRIGKI